MNGYLLLILLFLVSILIYQKIFLPLNYWRRRNVFQVYPVLRFLKVLLCLSNESLPGVYKSICLSNKNRRYFGTYLFLQPALLLNDVDLVKQMTITDFEHFHDRIDFLNNSSDRLLNSNLVSLTGKKWREMRLMLSPAFTTSKIKAMYPLICNTAKFFSKHLEQKVAKNTVFEVDSKELFEKYSNDVIVNCCFGIELNSLQESKENPFLQVGKLFTTPKLWTVIKGAFFLFIPKLYKFFSITILPLDIANIFIETIMKAIDQRENLKIFRPDLIHLMVEAKKGRLKNDTNENLNETGFAAVKEHKTVTQSVKNELILTNDVIASQTGLMFLAGFATSLTFLQFFAYEMALNPEIQKKLQQEIVAELSKNEDISYGALIKMKYLDQTVCEVFRKWPSSFIFSRLCTKEYVIEPVNSNEKRVVVEKGSMILVPAIAFHYDPDLFADPEKFDPEHFSDENKAKTVSGSFLPFGQGPRNCIGSRMGLLLIKAQVVNLLYKFDIVPTKKTRIPIRIANSLLTECKDVWLGLRKRS